MRLQAWMRMNRHTDRTFIDGINEVMKKSQAVAKPYGWRSVAPWRVGVCVPRPHIVSAIEEFTGGQVTYRDMVDEVREAGFRTRHHPPSTKGAA